MHLLSSSPSSCNSSDTSINHSSVLCIMLMQTNEIKISQIMQGDTETNHYLRHNLSPLWSTRLGLRRPQPSHPGPCGSYNGLHPCGQDHGVPLWATEEMSEGRRPVCEEDSCCVCSKAPRYQCPAGGGPRLPGHPERPHLWLQPHGTTPSGILLTGYWASQISDSGWHSCLHTPALPFTDKPCAGIQMFNMMPERC